MRRLSLTLVPFALAAACAPRGGSADTAAAAATTATPAASTEDADRATAGGGVPSGWSGRTDKAQQQLADAHWTQAAGGAWEVTTGPAHVAWRAADTASGAFTARATFEQLEAPSHPEAYGLVVGGRDLEGAGQRYTYFLVRGDGRYTIKAREGDAARTLVDWTESPAVPKQDAAGKARYDLAVEATADSLRLTVNGQRAGAVARQGTAADGIVGVRVNHNLHLRVTPVAITKR